MAREVKLKLLREQFGTVEMNAETKTFTITNTDGESPIIAIVNDDEEGNKGVECEDERFADRVKYALRRVENALYPMPDYFEDGDDYSGDS